MVRKNGDNGPFMNSLPRWLPQNKFYSKLNAFQVEFVLVAAF